MNKYKVYYMKSTYFRDGVMGYDWLREKKMLPDRNNLEKTHVFLIEQEAKNLEDLFFRMQGEEWSPKGEARAIILSKDLRHTSMCVGDIAVDEVGTTCMVDRFGFKQI